MDKKLSLDNFPVAPMTQEELINLKKKSKKVPNIWKGYAAAIPFLALFLAIPISKIHIWNKIVPSWLQGFHGKNFETSNGYFETVFLLILIFSILGIVHYRRYRLSLLDDLNEGNKIIATLNVVSKTSSYKYTLKLNIDNSDLKNLVVTKEEYELVVIGNKVELHIAKKSKELLHYKIIRFIAE